MDDFNKIVGPWKQAYCSISFILRKSSHVISHHFFNCTRSIEIGEGSCIAGIGSQFWTHGFMIGSKKTIRVDGDIKIGKKCYVGSRSIVMSGINVVDCCCIGAGTIISKNLKESGIYVSSPMRKLENSVDERIEKFENPITQIGGMDIFLK